LRRGIRWIDAPTGLPDISSLDKLGDVAYDNSNMDPWASTVPAIVFHSDKLAVRESAETIKMLKMKIDPAICMKTKESMTQCHPFFAILMDIFGKSAEFCRFVSGKDLKNRCQGSKA
jgi:hypothetical protein